MYFTKHSTKENKFNSNTMNTGVIHVLSRWRLSVLSVLSSKYVCKDDFKQNFFEHRSFPVFCPILRK